MAGIGRPSGAILQCAAAMTPQGGQWLLAKFRHTARHGFTLIELLVVITIIGLLVALSLPAMQGVRESGRALECKGNLRQLATAARGHLSAHGVFPYSVAYDTPHDRAVKTRHGRSGAGWILRTLPYLDQQPLFDQFQENECFIGNAYSQGLWRPACKKLMTSDIDLLRCPSDSLSKFTSTDEYQWKGTPVSLTSYKGVIGDTRMGGGSSAHQGSEPDCHRSTKCPGISWRHSYANPTTQAKVRDGESSTFLMGEDVPFHNHHSVAFYSNGDYASCHAPLNYMPQPPTPDHWWNVMSSRSLHVNGAHFVFVDASVHFVNEAVDYSVYRALSTKAGNEEIDFP